MIKEKDVIRLRIPYSKGLIKKPHMYILINHYDSYYEFVKCQSYKPTKFQDRLMKDYIMEESNPSRNPFIVGTIIDCDKVFLVSSIHFDDSLKTSIRENISDDLLMEIKELTKK